VPFFLRAKESGMDCGVRAGGSREGEEEVGRGGWAEVARQSPVIALVPAFGDRFI
jgi:hypothetical protein